MEFFGRLSSVTTILGLIGGLAFASPALAEKRVALVIGNSAYKNVGKLANPANDAAAVTAMLKKAGFEVVDNRRDIGIAELRRAIRDFSDRTRDADIAVVYYAGHGIEVDGTNYLVPVDAALERDVDVEDESLPVDRVLKVLEPVKRLRLVILDACRDNPFAKTMKRTLSSRSIGRGLAKVELTTSDTLIAFAAKAGSTAADGDGANSPFTQALVKHITEPGLDLRLALGRVRDDVLRLTSNKQEPFVYGSLGGSTVSLTPPLPVVTAPVAAPVAPAPAPARDANAEMRRDYELAAQIGTKEAWDSFLGAHSKGLYADLARAARSKILASEKAETDAAAAKARAEAAEKANAANAKTEAAKAEAAKAAAAKAEREKTEAADRAKMEAERSKAETAAKADAAKAQSATQVAALPPAGPDSETTRSLQSELRRVGCHLGSIDGNWNAGSRQALENFNRYSGMKLEAKVASLDALDAVKSKGSRICPLTCERGFKADGERCVAIVCPSDQVIGGDGKTCEKKPSKAAAKPEPKRAGEAAKADSGGGTGSEVICDRGGCRTVKTAKPRADGSLPPNCFRSSTAQANTSGMVAGGGAIVCN